MKTFKEKFLGFHRKFVLAPADKTANYKQHIVPRTTYGRIGGSRGGGDRGSGPPLKNRKNIGFICNAGPDPLKNHKASEPAFNVVPSSARQRNAISAGGPMMTHL